MTCWFHKWQVIHTEEPLPGFWFEDRKCRKCGKQKIVHGTPWFASIRDCAKLGAHIGVYTALGNGKIEKIFNDAIIKECKKKGVDPTPLLMRVKQ